MSEEPKTYGTLDPVTGKPVNNLKKEVVEWILVLMVASLLINAGTGATWVYKHFKYVSDDQLFLDRVAEVTGGRVRGVITKGDQVATTVPSPTQSPLELKEVQPKVLNGKGPTQ